jgi:adenosylmethionine-8-amino-7-oxononanoate aminotransferase
MGDGGGELNSTTRGPGSPGRDPIWHPYSRPDRAAEDAPLVFTKGDGVWLETEDGRRLIDGVGALEAMAVGHGRRRLVEAAARQMADVAFVDVFRHTTRPALDLARELLRIAPPGLTKVHFTPGGSEAVEAALKLAIQYHWLRGQRERRRVLVRAGAYHGTTFGAMNCDGHYHSTRNDIYLGPLSFGHVVPGPATGPDWGRGRAYASGAEEFARELDRLGPETVAAVVVDPLATASGVALAPAADLVALRQLCDETGVLLIVDEVITGFGRSGRLFVSDLYGVRPDILTVSKAIASGYMPIGAALIGERVVDAFRAAGPVQDAVFAHGHTYGAHPVACAVALENIRLIEEESLADRAAVRGDYLGARFASLRSHPSLVEARGIGLLWGLELVPAVPRAGLADPRAVGTWFRRRCRDAGLITLAVHPGNVMLLAPPLIITEAEIDALVHVVDGVLSELDGLLGTEVPAAGIPGTSGPTESAAAAAPLARDAAEGSRGAVR